VGTQIQYRRGTSTQNDAFTGALGEITVDTTGKTLRVHDGSTAGGNTVVNTTGVQTLSNKTANNLILTGNITAGGSIGTSGQYLSSTGVGIQWVTPTTSLSVISSGGSNVNVKNDWVNVAIAGSNVAGFNALGIYGSLQQASQTQITAIGTLTSLNVNGLLNVTGGNILASAGGFGSVNSTGFINTSGNVSASTGSFDSITIRNAVTSIVNGGTNGVGNIGASGATFNTVYAKATTAQYADLAEIYTSDQQYPSGTVMIFDGESEVTQSHSPHDIRIAGVVSTNPAYLMNHNEAGVPVALQGRVPCRVLGPVNKGDRVVSSHIAGVAQALDPQQYQPGCIIGKALQAIDSTDISIIEVVVGRL
jgi:hypothetical protein